MKLRCASFLLGVALVTAAAAAPTQPTQRAQVPQLWETLPPTPKLPSPERTGKPLINGVNLWYGEYGVRNKGIPVVLLHGGFGNSAYFASLITFLSRNGYHVIAVDSRGQGRSGRSTQPTSYHLMAQDVVGLLDKLGVQKADVVGWSDGGCIGYDLAINSPTRINRLFSFGADATVAGLKDGYGDTPNFVNYIARTKDEYAVNSPTPSEYQAFFADMMHMWNNEPNYTTEQLQTIKTPTTIADGQFDEGIRPEHNQYLVNSIPGSNLVILPNVSHFAMLQQPDQFNQAVLQFLKWR